MEDTSQLHKIEDSLSSTWLEEWAEKGIGEMRTYLAKHLAFLAFLDEMEPQEAPHESVARQIGSRSMSDLKRAA